MKPLSCLLFVTALGCGGARPSATGPAAAPNGTLGFFVTSRPASSTGAFGGLAGADAHCQALAAEVGAGARTWRAYLSTAGKGSQPRADARDRIGAGPWYNARGALVARDLDHLHQDGGLLAHDNILTERGLELTDAHDIVTGSDAAGRLAYINDAPATCSDWTSTVGLTRMGHSDRMDASSFSDAPYRRWNGSWNSAHDSLGCDAAAFARSGGRGQLYCFAADAAAPAAAVTRESWPATFQRGLNLNHWLGDNFPPEVLPRGQYGGAWFDEEDVAWIAAQGFDHVRVWVSGHQWLDANGHLDEAALAPFDSLLRWSRAHGLGVVLAMHSLRGYRAFMRSDPTPPTEGTPFTHEEIRADAAYLWWLLAHRYAKLGDALRFDVLNQLDTTDPAAARTFHQATLAAIRRVDSRRVVYLGAPDASPEAIAEVDLSDPHTIAAVEFYEPAVFTWQMEPMPLVPFPGKVPPLAGHLPEGDPLIALSGTELTTAAIDQALDALARRLPPERIYVARIGVYRRAEDDSARRYLHAVRSALDRNRLPWAVYDYHTGAAVRGPDGTPTRVLAGLGLPAAK